MDRWNYLLLLCGSSTATGGKGDVWSSASVVKRLSGTGFAKTNTKLSTTNAKMEGAHTEMARE